MARIEGSLIVAMVAMLLKDCTSELLQICQAVPLVDVIDNDDKGGDRSRRAAGGAPDVIMLCFSRAGIA
jgi:hypothetical protein